MFFGWLFCNDELVFFKGDDLSASTGYRLVANFFSVLFYFYNMMTFAMFLFTGADSLTSPIFFSGMFKESLVSNRSFLISARFGDLD